MNQIAEIRDKLWHMGYMRNIQSGKPPKQIFSEFVEHYVKETFNLELEPKQGTKGRDATYKLPNGKILEIQIKEKTRSESTFSNFKFDHFIAVELNDEHFSVERIYVFPKTIMNGKHGKLRIGKGKKHPELQEYKVYDKGKWKITQKAGKFLTKNHRFLK